ncbi:hypothetical protein E5358_01680 [Palleniella muris]|uniref:Uncharacterized protein n=1 Tax=Palleniella muris TaxID=3038145 RepID=A0AC61QUR0_9BACT|nr:hypothetical protein [Palleniella muris]TGX83907.1 hypothetical protein E5358_01680 [Palleniella muris]
MKRNIITMDGRGNIALPTDTGSIAMTEWEICELFGVVAPTFRAGIRALCKSRVVGEHEIKRTIRLSDKCSAEVYNLKAVIALAFRINTFGAEQVRNAILKRLCLRKE